MHVRCVQSFGCCAKLHAQLLESHHFLSLHAVPFLVTLSWLPPQQNVRKMFVCSVQMDNSCGQSQQSKGRPLSPSPVQCIALHFMNWGKVPLFPRRKQRPPHFPLRHYKVQYTPLYASTPFVVSSGTIALEFSVILETLTKGRRGGSPCFWEPTILIWEKRKFTFQSSKVLSRYNTYSSLYSTTYFDAKGDRWNLDPHATVSNRVGRVYILPCLKQLCRSYDFLGKLRMCPSTSTHGGPSMEFFNSRKLEWFGGLRATRVMLSSKITLPWILTCPNLSRCSLQTSARGCLRPSSPPRTKLAWLHILLAASGNFLCQEHSHSFHEFWCKVRSAFSLV